MNLLALDFETYYDKDFSLSKMTTSAYVRDERFEVICCSVQMNDEEPQVIWGNDLPDYFACIDWANTAIVAHNANFDAFVLTQHYGYVPARYYDTLSMVRAMYPYWARHSLDYTAKKLDLGEKIAGTLPKMKGKRLADLTGPERVELALYAINDGHICRSVYDLLKDKFPEDELDLIDLTIRLFAEPKLEVDVDRCQEVLRSEATRKQELLAKAEVGKAELMSNDKFAEFLGSLGVEAPTKISQTTGEETWAFAKTDPGFQALLAHPDGRVAAAAQARLAVKSTINETRAQRFVIDGQRGLLPVGYNYYGAHTGRWSGANKLNLQNLQRGGELRKSVLAPKGYRLVAADLSQIECRMLAWLADEHRILDVFAAGGDLYSEFATQFYGYPVANTEATKLERFVGKTCVLGLGYGMGGPKLQFTLMNGKPSVELELADCYSLVDTYRNLYDRIPLLWKFMDRIIGDMFNGRAGAMKCIEWGRWHVRLPNGMFLAYTQLEASGSLLSSGNYSYWGGRKRNPLYGGLLTENIDQALSRIVMGEAMLRVDREIPIVMHTHDELVALVPEREADDAARFMAEEMTREPTWCPGIPLAVEVGHGECYEMKKGKLQ